MGKKFINEEKLLEIIAKEGPLHPYKIAKIIMQENPNLNLNSVLASVQRSLKNMEKKTFIISKGPKGKLLKREHRVYGLTFKGLLSLSLSFEEVKRLVEKHRDFIFNERLLTETYTSLISDLVILKPYALKLEQEFLIDFIKSSKKNYEVILYLIDKIRKTRKFKKLKNAKLVKYLFNTIFNAIIYQQEYINIDKDLQKEIHKELKSYGKFSPKLLSKIKKLPTIDYKHLPFKKYIKEFIKRKFEEYFIYSANFLFNMEMMTILIEKLKIDNKEVLINSLRNQLIEIGITEENGTPILYYFKFPKSPKDKIIRFKNLPILLEMLETLLPELEKDEKYKEYVEKLKECIIIER